MQTQGENISNINRDVPKTVSYSEFNCPGPDNPDTVIFPLNTVFCPISHFKDTTFPNLLLVSPGFCPKLLTSLYKFCYIINRQ